MGEIERQGESQAGPMVRADPAVGFDLTTLGSRPEPKSGYDLSHNLPRSRDPSCGRQRLDPGPHPFSQAQLAYDGILSLCPHLPCLPYLIAVLIIPPES